MCGALACAGEKMTVCAIEQYDRDLEIAFTMETPKACKSR